MATQEISLDIPSDAGRIIYGAVVSATEFQATLKPPLFRTLVPDPFRLEERGLGAHHPELVEVAEMRRRVQRLIERAKKANIPDYAAYLHNRAKTGDGFAPQVVLWTPEKLITIVDEATGLGALVMPDEMHLIAIDGDTQAAARHMGRHKYSDMSDNERIKVTIVHGIGLEAAQQIFHDANSKGVKVSTSLAIGFDNRDPLTRLAKRIERETPELKDRVNYQKRQLGKSEPAVLTASALRTAVVCFAEGIAGVHKQTASVELPAGAEATIQDAALRWFRAVVKTLDGALEARGETFAAAPAVWAALGALGNKTVNDVAGGFQKPVDPTVLDLVFAQALEQLKAVNWKRGPHWLGAGAKSGKHGVTLGGPKEAGHLVYRSLTSREEPSFQNLRTAA